MPEMFKPRNPLEDTAEGIERRIGTLPEELRDRWEDRLSRADATELPELSRKLNKFIQERRSLNSQKAPPFMTDLKHLESDEGRIYATLARIGEAAEREDLYVGKGKAAKVFKDMKDSRVCYKSITNFEEYRLCNSIGNEAKYLEDLEDLVVDGVRTPILYTVIDLPSVKVISMEYLEAMSIEDILAQGKALPENFDFDLFAKRLRAYMTAMHARHIYHRDMHMGNILIAPDSSPYIIDFGKAAFAITEESAYEARDAAGVPMKPYARDELQLEKVLDHLKRYYLSH
ncbi:MAG: hypothetical protein JWM46_853 [Candidatus Kaiserbacteria bacterium]|nr:hypothetical protein [Candidatus Kaiserbacteria bacterium]